jgi:8-oxo-dGTP pyrophosphatase MutT (NUDIX family)
MEPWTLLERHTLLERRFLRVHEERVKLPTGVILDDFVVITAPSWAGALALTAEGEVVLVEQYRRGLGRASLELPAGLVDAGETPLETAERELLEETGYTSQSWHRLSEFSPEPMRSTSRAHFFVALGAERVRDPRPEASEVIRVHTRPVLALLEGIERGEIEHASHVGAILLAERRGFLSSGAR